MTRNSVWWWRFKKKREKREKEKCQRTWKDKGGVVAPKGEGLKGFTVEPRTPFCCNVRQQPRIIGGIAQLIDGPAVLWANKNEKTRERKEEATKKKKKEKMRRRRNRLHGFLNTGKRWCRASIWWTVQKRCLSLRDCRLLFGSSHCGLVFFFFFSKAQKKKETNWRKSKNSFSHLHYLLSWWKKKKTKKWTKEIKVQMRELPKG
jgi:hypothetical protein